MSTIRKKINLGLMATIGAMLPSRRHPFGKIGNLLRCRFARQIGARVGKDCIIEKGAQVQEGVHLADNSRVGEHCLISTGTVIEGNNMMGPHVHIYTSNHAYDAQQHRFDGFSENKPVTIGEHTWIGYGAIILPGVKIGRNSIIGAGAVVTKNVPSGVLAAGNPCVVKKIIDQQIYEEDI